MTKVDVHTWPRAHFVKAINRVEMMWRGDDCCSSSFITAHVLREWCKLEIVVMVLILKYL